MKDLKNTNLSNQNKEIIEKLKIYLLTEKHLLENSISSYTDDIIKYLEFMENHNIKTYKNITYKDINKYLKYLDDNKYSIYSVVRKISSIKMFHKYLSINYNLEDCNTYPEGNLKDLCNSRNEATKSLINNKDQYDSSSVDILSQYCQK